MYTSDKYKTIICFEPDIVALRRLKRNIHASNLNNIIIIEKALSNKIETISFGGNGKLGNSQSTMLINTDKIQENNNYCNYGDKILVETITLEKTLQEHNINYKSIKLIKMDIEGGEIIVLPSIKNFLIQTKIPLYISLHKHILKPEDINKLIIMLFNIYENCEITSNKGIIKVSMNEVMNNKHITDLLFF